MPGLSQIKRQFGSLNNAVIAAGLPVGKYVFSLSNEELLEKLRQKAREIGDMPSIREIEEDPDIPNEKTFAYRFGSYNKAVEAAGLKPNKRGASNNFRSIKTNEELLDQLRQKANELGKTPSVKDIASDPSMMSPATYTKRFGSYSNAVELAGLKPNAGRHKNRS